MKVIPARKALVLLAVCLGLAAPAGYLLKRLFTSAATGIGGPQSAPVQMPGRESRAAYLLRSARTMRSSSPEKAVALFRALWLQYPESDEAGEAMLAVAEMASTGQAPAARLEEIYNRMLATHRPGTPAQKAKACRYQERAAYRTRLEALDSTHEWQLRWQIISDSARDGAASDAMSYLTDLLDAARYYQGEAYASALLLKAVRSPELENIQSAAADLLLRKTEEARGAGEALTLAEALARERPDSQAGLEAFRCACGLLKRLKDDPAVLAFLEECRALPGNGLVRDAATAELAARCLERKEIEAAVSLYCAEVPPSAPPKSVLNEPPRALREAAERLAAAAGGKGPTAVSILESLADAAAERKLYGASRDLYSQAAAVCHAPELGTGREAETAFAEPDAVQFWQAYLLWHQGETRRGREGYESLLARYHQGWQAAQMMYDLAARSLQRHHFEEAVEWTGRTAQVLPMNPAVTDLGRRCAESLAADRPLAAMAAELNEAVKSADRPEAKAQGLMKLAEVQFQRGRYDDGALALRQVWERFPESPFAPKAMFRAGEVLAALPEPAWKAEARTALEGLALNYPTDALSPRAFDLLKKLEGEDDPSTAFHPARRDEMLYAAGGLEGRERPSKGLQRKDANAAGASGASAELAASILERHRGEAPVEYGISKVQSDFRIGVPSENWLTVKRPPEAQIPGADGENLAAEDPGEYYESAAEALLREGRTNEALDVIALGLQGRVTRAGLKEFLLACKARSDQELSPAWAGRILPWADTCAGLQALARMLRWRVVNAEGVEGLCRALQEKAPLSRAAMLARVSEAGEALRRKDFPGARNLLSGLTDPKIPPEIRVPALECAADGSFLQGNYREADKTYRKAAGEYIYEQEIPGSGLFSLKEHELAEGAPSEDWEVDGLCVKGYLLLARGERCEGIACLNRALARLDRLPADSEVSGLRTADVRLLLAAAYWAQGDRTSGARQGEMALRHLLKKTEPRRRAELLAFAETVCRSALEETPAASPNPAKNPQQTLDFLDASVVREGKYGEARQAYEAALRDIAPHDSKTAQAICNGVLQCLVRERPGQRLETAFFHFATWAARSLPDEYEGCAPLAVAKACYLQNDLERASSEAGACRALGTDGETVLRAQWLAGLIEFRAGSTAEAVRSLEAVLAASPPKQRSNSRVLALIGDADMVSGNTQKAREVFDLLTREFPRSMFATDYKDSAVPLNSGPADPVPPSRDAAPAPGSDE